MAKKKGERKIVFLPPSPWVDRSSSPNSLFEARRGYVQDYFRQLGHQVITVNPLDYPWNPLGKSVGYLRGIDPLRTLHTLTAHRDATWIISVFETPALPLLLIRKFVGFKPLVVLWDASPGNPWWVVQRAQQVTLPRYDAFMLLTKSQISWIRTAYRINKPFLHLGYNIDETFFRPTEQRSENYVLAVGDDRSRDFPSLLIAAEQIPSRVLIKSNWSVPEGIAIPPNVSFIRERLSDAAFRSLYDNATMVVLPLKPGSHAGGITTLFEAMSMGKPVILTPSGIAADYITHGFNGLITSATPQTIADAARQLLSNPTLRAQLGTNARITIESHWSSAALAKRMADFLEQISRFQS